MRYFKYNGLKKTEKNALKAQYAELTEREKRLARKGKTLNTIAAILFFTISIICFLCSVLAIEQIPVPEEVFGAILHYVGDFILILAALVVSLLIGVLAASPVWNKAETNQQRIKQQVLSKACAHLREYYGLQEPCMVTKCYDSSKKRFANHDVCIFVADDELRITTNLKHGFFHTENDLGCYAFKREEISLTKIQGEKLLIAELCAGDTVFQLGYRAKGFIEKNFISKGSAAETSSLSS